MATAAHRSKVRRAERAVLTAHGSINLVPLIDILTSIVFFSLLTYSGETMSRLTAFDLTLPPMVITAENRNQGQAPDPLNMLLAVRIESGHIQIEHAGNNIPFKKVINGYSGAALDTLEATMRAIRQQFPQNSDALVAPSDEVLYDDVVHVLERIKLAGYTGISLGNRARSQTVATAGATR
jgi:biopolymer transport protein ExbD